MKFLVVNDVMMANGAEKFLRGDRVPEDTTLVGSPQGRPITWLGLREADRCMTHRISCCDETWGRPAVEVFWLI